MWTKEKNVIEKASSFFIFLNTYTCVLTRSESKEDFLFWFHSWAQASPPNLSPVPSRHHQRYLSIHRNKFNTKLGLLPCITPLSAIHHHLQRGGRLNNWTPNRGLMKTLAAREPRGPDAQHKSPETVREKATNSSIFSAWTHQCPSPGSRKGLRGFSCLRRPTGEPSGQQRWNWNCQRCNRGSLPFEIKI